MKIRRAAKSDADNILDLLSQVEHIHYLGRPDIFKLHGTKFTRDELTALMDDEKCPILVADEGGEVVGYTFCILSEISNNPMLLDAKTMHIEDVCVSEKHRGARVGSALIEYAKNFAKELGCTRIDLDVWEFNEDARRFYEHHGFNVQKRRMDFVFDVE